MRFSTSTLGLLAGFALVFSATVHAQAREEGRLLIASQVLEELRDTPDQSIPDRLLDRAYGIAVIPDLTKIAFFAGGRWGRGVLVVRDSKGQFGNPVFISMTGGSFGWQWGVQSTDIVLVFTTEKGVRGFSGGKLTLGADASVAAGPVGRSASAATDQSFKAEVYSYSRNRGLFAGLALDGTVISISDSANEEFYKKPNVSASEIINGSVSSQDPAVQRFMAAVATSTGIERTASVAGPGPVPPAIQATTPAPLAPAPKAPAPASGGAQTFPLADPAPGQEPK
jgi:lipid-binding SYLF domain-containing protein